MEEVKDTLYEVGKWAKAYKILEQWKKQGCDNDDTKCENCGFNSFCSEAHNLLSK